MRTGMDDTASILQQLNDLRLNFDTGSEVDECIETIAYDVHAFSKDTQKYRPGRIRFYLQRLHEINPFLEITIINLLATVMVIRVDPPTVCKEKDSIFTRIKAVLSKVGRKSRNELEVGLLYDVSKPVSYAI